MSCTNNLKQIGLGVHNFHDSQKGIPPYNIALRGSLSFFGVIFPYIEQQALYEPFSSLSRSNEAGDVTHSGFAVPLDNVWWDGLDSEYQNGLGSVASYKCPSRRSGTALFTEFDASVAVLPELFQSYFIKGPQEDYAVVIFDHAWDPTPEGGWTVAPPMARMSTSTGSGLMTSAAATSATPTVENTFNKYINEIRSPIRNALFTRDFSGTNETLEWTPRDEFGFVADGLSNQFLLGEKHIPSSQIGVCSINKVYDGTYLSSSTLVYNTFSRHLFRYGETVNPTYLAREANESANISPTSTAFPQFGSFHTGLVNFLVGDGSVHGVSVTTNRDILEAFANASDGIAVALP
jgi:hypothetical protein